MIWLYIYLGGLPVTMVILAVMQTIRGRTEVKDYLIVIPSSLVWPTAWPLALGKLIGEKIVEVGDKR